MALRSEKVPGVPGLPGKADRASGRASGILGEKCSFDAYLPSTAQSGWPGRVGGWGIFPFG